MFVLGVLVSILILVLIVKWLFAPSDSEAAIYKTFNIDRKKFKLVGHDLGRKNKPIYLSYRAVSGAPDAFFTSGGRHMVVAERKGRRFRGFIRWNEYYQVLLYIGMTLNRYKATTVKGVLKYNDQIIEVPFDPVYFKKLTEELSQEAIRFKNIGTLESEIPLQKRISRIPKGMEEYKFS